jgi:4'-phosphopantetheinyl transferase
MSVGSAFRPIVFKFKVRKRFLNQLLPVISVFVARSSGRFADRKFNVLLNEMPARERALLKRYRRWEDAQSTLIGRVLLKEGLKERGLNLTDLELKRSEFNKPIFDHGPDFNISHSGEYVVCAICSTKIGIDIERKIPISFQDFKDQWHGNELQNLQQASSPLDLFYSYWTRKESVLKGDSRGLSFRLSQFDVSRDPVMLNSTPWFLHELEIDGDYCCHAATEVQGLLLEVNQISV